MVTQFPGPTPTQPLQMGHESAPDRSRDFPEVHYPFAGRTPRTDTRVVSCRWVGRPVRSAGAVREV